MRCWMMEFAPKLEILPPSQRRLWDELSAVPPMFALYGDSFHVMSSLKALTYFEGGDLDRLDRKIRDRLVAAVAETDIDDLPRVAAPALMNAMGAQFDD